MENNHMFLRISYPLITKLWCIRRAYLN